MKDIGTIRNKIKEFKLFVIVCVLIISAVGLKILITENTTEKILEKAISLTTYQLDENERHKFEKYVAKILRKGTVEGIRTLIECLDEKKVETEQKSIILEQCKIYPQHIDYAKLLDLYINEENVKDIKESLREVILKNELNNNEDIFISGSLVNTYNKWHAIEIYINDELGTQEKLFGLDWDIEEVLEAYKENDISSEIFNRILEHQEDEEIKRVCEEQIKYHMSKDNLSQLQVLNSKITHNEVLKQNVDQQVMQVVADYLEQCEKVEQTREAIEKLEDQYKEVKQEISELEKSNSNLEKIKKTNDAQKSVLEISIKVMQPFTIEGYIVAEVGERVTDYGYATLYEAAYLDYNYYGEVPSKERFLLEMYTKTYNSKGRFSLLVRQRSSEEVRVKEDMGGFKQTWKVYAESTDQVSATYYEDKKRIEELTQSNEEIDKSIQANKEKLRQLQVSFEKYTKEKAALEKVLQNEKDVKVSIKSKLVEVDSGEKNGNITNQPPVKDPTATVAKEVIDIKEQEILQCIKEANSLLDQILSECVNSEKQIQVDRDYLGLLEEPFTKVDKVKEYLGKYWSKKCVNNLISTYKIQDYEGRCYVQIGDGGTTPDYDKIRTIFITDYDKEKSVIVDIPNSYPEDTSRTMWYRFIYEDGKWVIEEFDVYDIGINEIDEVYMKYTNERYGFSIEYPKYLTDKMIPQNNAGIELSNKEKAVSLSVNGINNTFETTAKENYEKMILETPHILYKYQKDNWYVFSWQEGETMYYMKEVVGKGSINSFVISYPAKDEKMYDAVVEKLYSSFQTPNIDKSW